VRLEQAIAYIDDDELIDVAPKSIRPHNALLCRMSGQRPKTSRKKEAA
jgi:predicted membrane GTPase involved in stress response